MHYEALEKLVRLRDAGALTAEEFEQQRQQFIVENHDSQDTRNSGVGWIRGFARKIESYLPRGKSSTKSRRGSWLLTLLALMLLGGGTLGYIRFEDWRAAQAAHRAEVAEIKRAFAEQTAGASNLIASEYEDSKLTYGELFLRIDDRLTEIDGAIIKVQTSGIEDNIKYRLVEYGKYLGESLRLMQIKYRKSLQFSVDIDELKSVRDDYYSTPYNRYSNDWEIQRVNKSSQDAKESLNEFIESRKSFGSSLSKLRDTVIAHQTHLKEYTLIDVNIIDLAYTSNEEADQISE